MKQKDGEEGKGEGDAGWSDFRHDLQDEDVTFHPIPGPPIIDKAIHV